MTYRSIITEDHTLFRSALHNALHRALPATEWFETCSPEQLQQLKTHPVPDFVFLNPQIPGTQDFSGLQISEACTKSHATTIFSKPEVNNRTQAVIIQQLEFDPADETV